MEVEDVMWCAISLNDSDIQVCILSSLSCHKFSQKSVFHAVKEEIELLL